LILHHRGWAVVTTALCPASRSQAQALTCHPQATPRQFCVPSLVPEFGALIQHNWGQAAVTLPPAPWGQSWNFDTLSPGCADAVLRPPGPRPLLYSVILGSVPLLHTVLLGLKSCTSPRPRPWFHGRSVNASTSDAGVPAAASASVHDDGSACNPALGHSSTEDQCTDWVPGGMLSTRTSFHGQQRRTGEPQQPLPPRTAVALATTATGEPSTKDPHSLY